MSVASASQSGVTANRPDEPAEPRKDRLITRDVALVMLATFFFMTSNMVITPVIAGYGESMGATGALMGVIAGAMSFVSLFCRPIAGNLSDLVSKRLLVAAGTVLYIVAGVMYCLADSTGMLAVARMVNGLGFACGTVCLATWVSLLLPIRHMGAGMGLYGIVNALAIAVGPALGIRLQAAVGYQWTFIASLTLNVCAFVTVLLVKNGGRPARKTVAAEQSLRHRLRLRNLVEPRAIPLAAVFMMFAIPYFANQSFLVDYISARHLRISSDLFFVFYAAALLVLRLTLRDLFEGFPFLACRLFVCDVGVACLSHVHDERLVSAWRGHRHGGQLWTDEFRHAGAGGGDRRPGAQWLGQRHVLYGHRLGYGVGAGAGWSSLWAPADRMVLSPVHAGAAGVLADLPVLPPSHPSVAQVTDRHRSR